MVKKENLLDSTSGIPDEFKGLIAAGVIAGLVLGLAIEAVSANSAQRRARKRSYLTNISTFLFNDTVVSVLAIGSLVTLAQHYSHSGLLSALKNQSLKLGLGFVLLDLVLYLWHRACHSYDVLWMFHKVHHSDTVMNVTTSFRLHILEVGIVTLIKAVVVVVTGLDAATVALSEGLITLFVLFHHLDIRFHAERWLGWLFTVPTYHRVHHSTLRREQNRNFGAALSVWDRLLGTLAISNPEHFGLHGVGEQGFYELLRFGFTPERRAAQKARRFIPRVPLFDFGR